MSNDYPMLESQVAADQIQLLGHVRKTPTILYGIFLELLKIYYSDRDNVPLGIKYIWEDKPDTELYIDSVNRIGELSEVQIERVPAIFVALSDINYQGVYGGTANKTPFIGMDMEEGEKFYSRLGSGSVDFLHIGTTKGESQNYAAATLDFFDGFSPVIRNDFCFETFAPILISKAVQIKNSKDRYLSVVKCNFSFQDTWSLKLESPKLKAVYMQLHALSERPADNI